MNYELPAVLIVLIPIVALVDYFAFRKRFQREGIPITWHYFVLPCTLEVMMFCAGYVAGKGGL
jgi:hypothetical protein